MSFLNPNIERVNLGQTGYSIDQAYLFFNRLKEKVPHHIHVFAVTGLDFERMTHPKFNERYKPIFGLQDGQLRNLVFPIPQSEFVARRLANFISGGGLKSLKVIELAERALPKKPHLEIISQPTEDEMKAVPIAMEVFKVMQQEARKKNEKLIVVYLPTYYDYYVGRHRELRKELLRRFSHTPVPYYDLTTSLSTVPIKQIVEGGNGHYTAAVHELVAKEILKLF